MSPAMRSDFVYRDETTNEDDLSVLHDPMAVRPPTGRGDETMNEDDLSMLHALMAVRPLTGKPCKLDSTLMSELDCLSRPATPSTVADTYDMQEPSILTRDTLPDLEEEDAASSSHIERWHHPDETLIFFDFDDTLCPSTHIARHPEIMRMMMKVEVDHALEKHEAVVTRLLQVAVSFGQVHIVTMARYSWVEQCITALMPGLKDTLSKLKIPIVSAKDDATLQTRRQLQSDGREPAHFLKTRAMKRIIRKFYGSGTHRKRSWKNILSIGDSEAERCALQDIVWHRTQQDRNGAWKDCRCKTLLLQSNPVLEDLTAQLNFVEHLLPAVILHDGDLDMDIQEEDLEAARANLYA